MLAMPPEFLTLIRGFQPLFSKTVFEHATVLLVGAILAPGARTVTNCLRMMGLDLDYQNYHRVLNRAKWSARQTSQHLLVLLVDRFAPEGPLASTIALKDDAARRSKPRASIRCAVARATLSRRAACVGSR